MKTTKITRPGPTALRGVPRPIGFIGRVTFDKGAGVYEAWADKDCQQHLGCFDTSREAHAALYRNAREG